MSLGHIGVVWRKEMLDTIRERRTVIAILVVPLVLMPLLAIGPQLLIGSNEASTQETTHAVALDGAAAPDLRDRLEASDGLRVADVADPATALADGDVEAVLVIPEGFPEALAEEASPPPLTLRFDATRSSSQTARDKLTSLLQAYREGVVADRLRERGLSPDLLEPFAVRTENVGSQEAFGAFLLGFFLPFFLILYASIGGSQTAIDVSAGEKERGTLESLLVAPPARTSLVVGKFLAIWAVTLVAAAVSLLGLALAFGLSQRAFPGNPVLSQLEFAIAPTTVVLLFAVTALVAAMMSALTFALFAWTRNFKEAQTYTQYVVFPVMVPAFIVGFTDVPSALGPYLIPLYNAAAVIKALVLGDASATTLAVTALSTAVYSAASLALAVRIFQNERVLFRQ